MWKESRVLSSYIVFRLDHLYLHNTESYNYSGLYEYNVVKYLARKAKESKSCLFIDIGAYIGYYSILMSREGCNVLAFEPDPRSLILLFNNINMNGLDDKIKVFNIAICDKNDSQMLFKLSKSPSESSFTSYLRGELIEFAVPIPCTTLDSLISKFKPSVDKMFIKIDVEGAASQVLRGGMSVVTGFKPYIVLEIHRTFDRDDELMVLSILRRYGYRWRTLEWRSPRNFIVALEPQS